MPDVTKKQETFNVTEDGTVEESANGRGLLVKENGDKIGALNKRELLPHGLTKKELAFVSAYIETGSNGAEAARRCGMGKKQPNVAAYTMLQRPAVREAIKALLATQYINSDFVAGRFAHFAINGEKETTRLKATAHIAKFFGIGAPAERAPGNSRGPTLNVQLNVPGRSSRIRTVEVNARRSDGAKQVIEVETED
jgi:hypothetical protein